MSQSTLIKPINCLRCRACKLLPETDMSQKTPIVWCEKQQDRTPLLVAMPCALANPRTRYEGNGWDAVKTDGDKTCLPSDVERAWLAARYPTASQPRQLAEAIGRDYTQLKSMASRNGWRRSKEAEKSTRSMAVQAQRKQLREASDADVFTAAQRAYLLDRYQNGEWPTRGGNRYESRRVKNQAIRADIEAQVAKRGPARSWKAIRGYLGRQAPGYLKWRRAHYVKRKAAQSALKKVA